jgi:hypothetical protein
VRTRAEIVSRARLHVGHREVGGPNRSPLIDAWLRRCGVGPGLPWCAAFASWCVEEREETEPGLGPHAVACAGALRLGRLFPATREPLPGDLMFFATDTKGAGHIGIVVAGDATYALCIEGNSANCVRYVLRLRSEVLFARTRSEAGVLPSLLDFPKTPIVRVTREGTR